MDNDCDGEIDEEDALDALIWYADGDGDGYGDATDVGTQGCTSVNGHWSVINNMDCDDENEQISPEGSEICDGIDNNCNFLIDDDDEENIDLSTTLQYYPDVDGDGYGSENAEGIKLLNEQLQRLS